ncbi:kinase-like domain-containing protein [Dunaliella salina]|uniref:Kinase-like domain-containing protein n=1 Tax=Dunaliella salina TaxID=3046 RepID=A0ABQ7GY58_DUNSA|nr:kinase-like domain-containing protein [Dunaliella salina]|eukprot:KAF5839540.1 kinase-like domain-containing protein [Dunaliella salina]
MLGCGSSSRVYEGTWNGRQVAVRRMVHSPRKLKGLQRALGICQKLKHRNVVEQLHSFTIDYSMSGAVGALIKKRWEVEVQRTSPCSRATISTAPFPEPLDTSILLNPKKAEGYRETFAVQELCNQGSLSSALYVGHFTTVAADGNWCPNLVPILEVASGVAAGMEYLHSQSICHGDLQASCVLLNTDADGSLVAKVLPSEVQRLLGSRHTFSQTDGMSPRHISRGSLQPHDDVLSFGFLIWEMVAGTASPHSSSSGCSAGCKEAVAFPPGMHKVSHA